MRALRVSIKKRANNSLMLTRLAGENLVVLGQPSSHTVKEPSPSRRAA
jgi:hypothetical protein